MQVTSDGLPARSDWNWQSLKELGEDVPEKREEFLRTTKRKRQAENAKKFFGLSLVVLCFHAECNQIMDHAVDNWYFI